MKYCSSQNITKHKLTAYLMICTIPFLIFISTLTDIGKLTGYFYNHINKKGYFYSHENITSYGMPL